MLQARTHARHVIVAKAANDAVTLAVFVSEKKEDLQTAAALAKKHDILTYVAPDKNNSAINP